MTTKAAPSSVFKKVYVIVSVDELRRNVQRRCTEEIAPERDSYTQDACPLVTGCGDQITRLLNKRRCRTRFEASEWITRLERLDSAERQQGSSGRQESSLPIVRGSRVVCILQTTEKILSTYSARIAIVAIASEKSGRSK